ncbi:hypothetical protein BsWGS_03813 [Bradybaena similaris]
MSDSRDRKKQHVCFICSEPTTERMPMCQRCEEVKMHHFFNGSFLGETQTPETTCKSKVKKKKRKNKRKQAAEQNESSNETLKVGLDRNKQLQDERVVDKPIKVDARAKTGESFGEGWWKVNPKATSSEKKDQSKLTYKDFYSDSEDEIEDKLFKEKNVSTNSANPVTSSASASTIGVSYEEAVIDTFRELVNLKPAHTAVKEKTRLEYNFFGNSEDTSSKVKGVAQTNKSSFSVSDSAPAASVSLEEDMSKVKLEKTEAKATKEEQKGTGNDQRSSKWGKCSYCKKKGYVLCCSRCKMSSYCDRECQKSHYPQHKEACRRKDRFNLVASKITHALKRPFIRKYGGFLCSQRLSDLPHESFYAEGARMVVMVEIVGPFFHPIRYGVVIRDVVGEESHIVFYNDKPDVFKDKISKVEYPLPVCLCAGNFIILLDTYFHDFLDGTEGIRIDCLSQLHFILDK